MKRQKAIEEELDCKFIRINPDKQNFDMHVEIGKIYNYINESDGKLTKKSLIDKIPKRLLELQIKLNHPIKHVVKKMLPSL